MSGFGAAGTAPAGTTELAGEYVSMLVVEDGTIVSVADGDAADANTLVSEAFVTSHSLLTGQSVTWAGLSSLLREQAIFRAMQKLIGMEDRFLGWRTSSYQVLPFPRYGMVVNDYEIASNVIPTPIKQAQAELALREAETFRATMPDETFTGGMIEEEDKQVGKIRKRVKYAGAKNAGQQPYYPAVLALLRPYMLPVGVLLKN